MVTAFFVRRGLLLAKKDYFKWIQRVPDVLEANYITKKRGCWLKNADPGQFG
jgi:mannose/cellobiose epimerase-like protein (N-acyl-D-glucosamine 2-epimerase family)